MKKKYGYIIALIILCLFMVGFNTFAMTVKSRENVQTSKLLLKVEKTNVIYLLDWRDKKMMTTKGTFYLSNDITVINQSGLDKEDIALQKNPLIVQIDKVGRQIQTIMILPNTQ